MQNMMGDWKKMRLRGKKRNIWRSNKHVIPKEGKGIKQFKIKRL